MRLRTLIAVQFALWAFFFSRIIPFSGDIRLPVVWIYDRRVFAGWLIVDMVDLFRFIPGAIAFVPPKYLAALPSWSGPWLIPMVIGEASLNISFSVWLGAWWLRRKIRKKAPDILEVR